MLLFTFYYSGSKYEDNLEQVSRGSLSTAILNRNNPEYSQTASTVASTTATTTATTATTSVRSSYP